MLGQRAAGGRRTTDPAVPRRRASERKNRIGLNERIVLAVRVVRLNCVITSRNPLAPCAVTDPLRRVRQRLRFDGESGVLPRCPATDERTRPRPACSTKLARHPGARRFIVSGTVDHQRRMLRQSLRVRRPHRIGRIHTYGPSCLNIISSVAPLGTCVDDDDRLTSSGQLLDFTDGNTVRNIGGQWAEDCGRR